MNTLKQLLQTHSITRTKITSERSTIVKQFFDELTLERRIDNYRRFIYRNRIRAKTKEIALTPEDFKKTKEFLKPLRVAFLGMRLAHLSEQDLYYLLSVCRDYKKRKGSFSKMFFSSIKVK